MLKIILVILCLLCKNGNHPATRVRNFYVPKDIVLDIRSGGTIERYKGILPEFEYNILMGLRDYEDSIVSTSATTDDGDAPTSGELSGNVFSNS